MGELVEFGRRARPQPKFQHGRSKRQAALWLSILLFTGVAAGGYFLSRSERTDAVPWGSAAARVSFTLCAERLQPNCVIDGDTIHYNGTRVRLADIDAPETHEPRCASELARGEKATLRLLELLNAGPFLLVRPGYRDLDRYGRELRVIVRGSRSLGEILVSEGLARTWDGARHPWCV